MKLEVGGVAGMGVVAVVVVLGRGWGKTKGDKNYSPREEYEIVSSGGGVEKKERGKK